MKTIYLFALFLPFILSSSESTTPQLYFAHSEYVTGVIDYIKREIYLHVPASTSNVVLHHKKKDETYASFLMSLYHECESFKIFSYSIQWNALLGSYTYSTDFHFQLTDNEGVTTEFLNGVNDFILQDDDDALLGDDYVFAIYGGAITNDGYSSVISGDILARYKKYQSITVYFETENGEQHTAEAYKMYELASGVENWKFEYKLDDDDVSKVVNLKLEYTYYDDTYVTEIDDNFGKFYSISETGLDRN